MHCICHPYKSNRAMRKEARVGHTEEKQAQLQCLFKRHLQFGNNSCVCVCVWVQSFRICCRMVYFSFALFKGPNKTHIQSIDSIFSIMIRLTGLFVNERGRTESNSIIWPAYVEIGLDNTSVVLDCVRDWDYILLYGCDEFCFFFAFSSPSS